MNDLKHLVGVAAACVHSDLSLCPTVPLSRGVKNPLPTEHDRVAMGERRRRACWLLAEPVNGAPVLRVLNSDYASPGTIASTHGGR